MPLPERLEGYGVRLRCWRPADAELLHPVVVESTEHLRPWMRWIEQEPLTVEQRRAMLSRWEKEWLDDGDAFYGIFVNEAVAGSSGLHRRQGPGKLEIGYWIHPAFLRQGIASAAARLLTDAAFQVPEIEYVEIHHDKANVASQGVPRGLGYELVGERPDGREAPAEVGIDCVWRMARTCWLERYASGP